MQTQNPVKISGNDMLRVPYTRMGTGTFKAYEFYIGDTVCYVSKRHASFSPEMHILRIRRWILKKDATNWGLKFTGPNTVVIA